MGWYHSHPFDVGDHSHCFLSQTDLSTELQVCTTLWLQRCVLVSKECTAEDLSLKSPLYFSAKKNSGNEPKILMEIPLWPWWWILCVPFIYKSQKSRHFVPILPNTILPCPMNVPMDPSSPSNSYDSNSGDRVGIDITSWRWNITCRPPRGPFWNN